MTSSNTLYLAEERRIAAWALQYKMPWMIFARRPLVDGAILSYGPDPSENGRVSGGYVGRILKGEKPGDLPVQQSTKVRLVINIRTARALGITFPLMLLGRADEVIE